MLSRRSTILYLSATSIAALSRPAFGENEDVPDERLATVEFPAGVRVPTVDEYIEELETVTGKENPYRDEVMIGRKLLNDIPISVPPYEIADRFHQWRQGFVGRNTDEIGQYKFYSKEWPVRGNPIIMGFFDATGLRKPAGDTTYWCAAFVSWSIERSRQGKGDLKKIWPYPNGAASSAYREHFTTVEADKDVQRGDLAVFKSSTNNWSGHIGFVHDIDYDNLGHAKTIWVLGGNQGPQNEYNGGEVNIAKFNRNSTRLALHSFRTDACLKI